MTAFADAMDTLNNRDALVDRLTLVPIWTYCVGQTGVISIINAHELKLRFGDMTSEQTKAIRQEIAFRLETNYKKRIAL